MVRSSKSRRHRFPALAAALVASALAAAGCAGSTDNSGSPGASRSTGGTLKLANTLNAPSTFNPWGPGYGINYSLWWSQALYDSLVNLDAEGKVEPNLATSWEQAGAKLTLKLRTDVKFTDGTPVDAKAVKANIDYAVAKPAGAECNNYLAGALTTAEGADTVTIELPTPFPGLLTDLGQCAGFIVNPKALADDKSLTANAAGSGPYTVDAAKTIAGQTYTFVRNDDYWNKKSFPYDKVVITQYESVTAATNAVQGGQADLVGNLVQSQTRGLGSSVAISSGQPNFFQGIWFIDTKGSLSKPLGDVRVRQAMNYAIDRKAIVDSMFGDSGSVIGSTPFAKFYEGYSDTLTNLYPYDVDKAKKLLAEAGYANGFSTKVISDPGGLPMAEAFAGMLSKIGIKLDVSQATSNFISEMQSGKFPMVQAAYTLNSAQYQTIRGIVGENGFWNPLHNSDPDVAALLDNIVAAPEGKAEELYKKLATTIADKALVLAPVISSQLTVSNPKNVTSKATPGIGVPMLYNMKPAS